MNPFMCKRCRKEHIGECADVADLIRQRDELLAALEFYANPTVYEPDSIGRRDDITFVARAAIAKARA